MSVALEDQGEIVPGRGITRKGRLAGQMTLRCSGAIAQQTIQHLAVVGG